MTQEGIKFSAGNPLILGAIKSSYNETDFLNNV